MSLLTGCRIQIYELRNEIREDPSTSQVFCYERLISLFFFFAGGNESVLSLTVD